MENFILDFYHYTHIINAYKFINQELGIWTYLLAIPLYKIRTLYIYTWWKLVLLHGLNFVSFVLVFNNNILATDIANIFSNLNIDYVSIESYYILVLTIIYLYTFFSVIFMYINAITFERYELLYNLKAIWTVIYTIFRWTFNLGVRVFEKFSTPVSTRPISRSNTNTQTLKKQQVSNKTIKPQTPTATNSSIPEKQKVSTPKQDNKKLNNVYTDEGFSYTLEKQIAFGGEGRIHAISSTLLAKIFHKGMATNEKKEKLLKLLSMKKMSSVVFPQKLLYNANKNFIGYTMNQIYNTKELGVLHIPANRKKYYPHWTYIDLLDLSITIANTLKRLHDQKIIVADFNPRNVLVKESTKIYFIDIDSYQIDRQASTVGMMMYTRPIHFNKSHQEYLKNQSDDIYALSVIIFQNLTSGANPYARKGGSLEDELIERHEFSFNVNEPYKSNVSDNLIDAWANLSDSLRDCFEQVFRFQKPISLSNLTKALENHKQTLTHVQTKIRRQTA